MRVILTVLALLGAVSACDDVAETRRAVLYWRDIRSQAVATANAYHVALATGDVGKACRVTPPEACSHFRAGHLPMGNERRLYQDLAHRWNIKGVEPVAPDEVNVYGTVTSGETLYAISVQLEWQDTAWVVTMTGEY